MADVAQQDDGIGALPSKVDVTIALSAPDAADVIRRLIESKATVDDPSALSPRLIEGAVSENDFDLELTRRGAPGLRERNSFRVQFCGRLIPSDQGSRVQGKLNLRFGAFIRMLEAFFAVVLTIFWLVAAVPAFGAMSRGEERGLFLLVFVTLVVFAFGSVVFGLTARSKRSARADASALLTCVVDQLRNST